MALTRTGARLITVDGTRYRWRVRGGAACCPGCAAGRYDIAVEPADGPGSVLLAATSAFPVVPSVVATAIRAALADGWQATRRGPAFQLARTVPGGDQ
ncbi:hypothetical protein ACFVHB_16270 [Kitasatospora sp. NPDC127111]|uniref:hypothetical protein n=1 Tax=Kitasatospora sp. NPDC127111 TaxID=3345363 RepID=UPI003633F1DB